MKKKIDLINLKTIKTKKIFIKCHKIILLYVYISYYFLFISQIKYKYNITYLIRYIILKYHIL